MATVFSSNSSQLVANFYLNGSGNSFSNLTVANTATIGNLIVTGTSNLGPVGNVKITGGTPGQVLITDGGGNLSWSTVSGTGTVTSVGNAVVDPSSLGFTLDGGPITGAGVLTLGVPDAATFKTNLGIGGYPNLNGNSSTVLAGDGNWVTVSGTGTVTSVNTSGAGLGFSLTGGPITTTGTATLTVPSATALRTTLGIGNVANANFNGNGQQVLAGNGAWVQNATLPGGATGQLQWNNGGAFAGSNITYVAATGNLDMDSKNITSVRDPQNPQDAATKFYVDSVAQGLQPKASVQAATTGPITLSGAQTVDGVTLVDGVSRVLVKNQAVAADNGVYVYSSTGPWTRATDYDTPIEAADGSFVFVDPGGVVNGSSGFVQTTTVTTLGVDPIVYAQFSSGGSYTAGVGLQLSGSQFSIADTGVAAGTYGNATTVPQITVNSRGQLTTVSNVAIALPTGNIANTNYDGNVSNVLAGDGTWVQGRTNSAGNVNEVQFAGAGNTFVASNAFSFGNNGNLVIGNGANANTANSMAIGANAISQGSGAISLGRNTISNGLSSIAIGTSANANGGATIAIGPATVANGGATIAIGSNARAEATLSVAIGPSANAQATRAVAIGANSFSNATHAFAIGNGAISTATDAFAIGSNTIANTSNTIVLGSSVYTVFANAVNTNGLLGINYGTEDVGVVAAAATGTINLDLLDNSIRFNTVAATGNVTLNVRGNATVTANSVVALNQSTVVTQLITTGATAFGITALQIDGAAQTIRWSGGAAPTAATNSTLAYQFTIIKTATTPTYTVLGSMTRFA